MLQKVLIIGGAGVFGARLVRHLARRNDIALFVASRATARAKRCVATVPSPAARLHAVQLDTAVNLQTRLQEIRPFITIDCSGPFQGASYDIARAVLQSGSHAIDLADARDYLAGYADALDETARQHGVAALTGASSTPTLSTCVVRHLTEGWAHVDTIDMAITPGGKSEVGQAVIDAILSYAGRDIPIWTSGKLSHTTGWASPRRVEIPGLGTRRVAVVETFDPEYLGPLLNVASRVAFFAGLESRIEQWGLETLATMRRVGILGDARWLTPVLLQARRLTRLPTTDTGGMLVEIRGTDANGEASIVRWSLVARQDHGPFVPILPIAAAVHKLVTGEVEAGARLAHETLKLAGICNEANDYPITMKVSWDGPSHRDVVPKRNATAAIAR